ncbi:MAG: antibiotic biosynthesis monooxygenase [Gammaproteobacteria bacterium]|nr:antibiotic biosynthesis monooxygenase [Gammaproteobacteria bacterium]
MQESENYLYYVISHIFYKKEYTKMVIVNLQLKIKTEKRDEFLEWFKAQLPDTRNYDGCSELSLCTLAAEPAAVDVISKWESQEKYDTYLAWREEEGTLTTLGSFVSEDPVFRFLTVEQKF